MNTNNNNNGNPLLVSTGTLKELQAAKARLISEADRMEGTRYGLVMDNYPKMLRGREIAAEAVEYLEQLEQSLLTMKSQITRLLEKSE